MLNMSEESRAFLEEYCPEAVSVEGIRQALDMVFDLITEKGYGPRSRYRHNEFGRRAQRVYDDLYLSNRVPAEKFGSLMLNMSEESWRFLKKYLPKVLTLDNINEALHLLNELILDRGFAPPRYEEYNDFGRMAQRVYDDLYYLNCCIEENENEKNR